MYTHHDSLLNSIKIAAIHKHLLPLLQTPGHRRNVNTAFEVYQYEERIEFGEIEEKIREEVLKEFNEHLMGEERGRLEMELFGLQKAVEIEQTEIEMLRLQINAERSNLKLKQLEQIGQSRQRPSINTVHSGIKIVRRDQYDKQKAVNLKDNSRLNIYPCVRVDHDPPRTPQDASKKQTPPLPLQVHAEQRQKEHQKSHRQMLATYTKRSLASSQQNQKQHQGHAETTKGPLVLKQQTSLLGLQRQIAFLQRAWSKARSQGQVKQSKKYKQQLMNLIGHFWQATK